MESPPPGKLHVFVFWFFNIVFEFNVTELCHDVSLYQLNFRIKIFLKICNNSSQQELGPPVVRQE